MTRYILTHSGRRTRCQRHCQFSAGAWSVRARLSIRVAADRFPDAVQPAIAVLPLTPLISSLRQVMLEGAGVASLAPELGLIVGWGVVSFAVALQIFRWE